MSGREKAIIEFLETGGVVLSNEEGIACAAFTTRKDFIESLSSELGVGRLSVDADTVAREIEDAKQSKIHAIKAIRTITGAGLAESKAAVEKHIKFAEKDAED